MKKPVEPFYQLTLGCIVAMASLLASCNEETFNAKLTDAFSLQSNVNGAQYKIQVALPASYDSLKTYGTLYVLDGEDDFGFVANRCQEISSARATDNVLVVSIGYGKDRSVDYTPTKTGSMTGGAHEFMTFIQDQLIPAIEQRYSADTSRNGRVILGHSYGGLFGAYAFVTNNSVFGNYLLLSPSLWYDNEVTMLMEKESRSLNQNRDQLVFMGLGEMENSGRMHAPFEAFHKTLVAHYNFMTIGRHIEPDLSHMGSKHPNIICSLEYYFEHRSF